MAFTIVKIRISLRTTITGTYRVNMIPPGTLIAVSIVIMGISLFTAVSLTRSIFMITGRATRGTG
jgi:hypothetical protein